MIKAVFLDYTGTILQEGGPDIEEMTMRCAKNSNVKDPRAMMEWWFRNLRIEEERSYGDSFRSEEDICMDLLKKASRELGLKEDLNQLQQLNINYWMYAPLYTDVLPFFERCTKPIYIISNNSDRYISVCLMRNGLHVNGIVCGDMVKAYKPHKELFEKALELSECSPEEVIHIGDSINDMKGASDAGITPILLDRKKKADHSDFKVIHSLLEGIRIVCE